MHESLVGKKTVYVHDHVHVDVYVDVVVHVDVDDSSATSCGGSRTCEISARPAKRNTLMARLRRVAMT
jgi:hypothetical protein